MSNSPVEQVIAQISAVYGKWGRRTSVAQMRGDWDDLFRARAAKWPIRKVDLGGVPAEWIAAPGVGRDRAILYLHGGGFRLGSINSHRDLIQRVSGAAQTPVLAVGYRLAPEHRFPAPVQDALAAYSWLLAEGVPASSIAFAGDSAGAGLAISTMLAARNLKLDLPRAAFLMSAWTDLQANGRSYETRAARDPIHQRPMVLAMAKGYLGADGDPCDPLASPLYGDLRGLPPMLMHCGGRETVLDDTIMFAEKARGAGVDIEVDVQEDMIHVFQMFAAELPEARQAIASGGAFLKKHLS